MDWLVGESAPIRSEMVSETTVEGGPERGYNDDAEKAKIAVFSGFRRLRSRDGSIIQQPGASCGPKEMCHFHA